MNDAESPAVEDDEFGSANDLTRRDFLRYAGYGTAALTLLSHLDAPRPAAAAPLISAAGYPPGGGKLQLPFWSDGANWNQPQYYETIQAGWRRFPKTYQSADINGDGQDELLARNGNGMLANVFDTNYGQWKQLPDGPAWSDSSSFGATFCYPTIQSADIDGDGQAELLGWDGYFVQAWKYNSTAKTWSQLASISLSGVSWTYPQSYQTFQSADIDGDGADELLARGTGGIQVWKYDSAANSWNPLNGVSVFSDANSWNQPQYYETIQCADIDGDGQAELMARNGNGVTGWKYSPATQTWNQLATNATFSDGGGWTNPQYYQTIQFADMDGDGRAELVARGANQIFVYQYNASGQWEALEIINDPSWTDANGWNQTQYYLTIQAADIDGDGQAELIGRAPDSASNGGGVQIWKYNPNTIRWDLLPGIAVWTDANGWNQTQYYSTIQTALVNSPAGLAGKQAVILGRGPLGMQTWYYDPNAQTWQQTSRPYPAFTPSQQAAYVQLDTALRFGEANGNIRSEYNDETANFNGWLGRMYPTPPADYNTPPAQRPSTSLPLPATNPPTQADWDAVTWQIYWEMSYVGNPGSCINDYYGNKVNGLINSAFGAKGIALQSVGGTLSLPGGSNAGVVLSIFSLFAQMTGAIAGLPALDAGTASAISNVLGVAFAASAQFLPNGGGGFQQAYNQLQTTLSDSFDQTVTANGNSQFAITGGADTNGNYVPGDWGLMAVIGPYIQNGVWGFSNPADIVVAMQQSYAITISQALLPAVPWVIWTNYSFYGPPSGFPSQYLYYSSDTQYCTNGNCISWISQSSSNGRNYPSNQALSLIFDPVVPNQWNPLGASVSDVYTGANGWPNRNGSGSAAPGMTPPRVAPGADLRVKTQLTRDAVTGEIVAAITLLNRGWTAAPNVEITQAQLQNAEPRGGLPTRHTLVARSKNKILYLRFPSLPAGQTALLRLSGRYIGGTFGGSFRIKIP